MLFVALCCVTELVVGCCRTQMIDKVQERNAPSENVTAASNTAVSHLFLYGQ